jgi:hypothetical protein
MKALLASSFALLDRRLRGDDLQFVLSMYILETIVIINELEQSEMIDTIIKQLLLFFVASINTVFCYTNSFQRLKALLASKLLECPPPPPPLSEVMTVCTFQLHS